MTEKSEKKETLTSLTTAVNEKRSRGRPKGAKNKPKQPSTSEYVEVVVKKRGRPPGAKNKPKQPLAVEVKYKPQDSEPVVPSKRGRPKKPEVLPVAQEQPENQAEVLDKHPLLQAVKWLEKHMHHTEVQYYRTRASKGSTSLQFVMVSDILGFFNVQNADICKQIKKNNFIDRVCNS
jgi:hypothetical protein